VSENFTPAEFGSGRPVEKPMISARYGLGTSIAKIGIQNDFLGAWQGVAKGRG
jgi:hypothetical protein